MTAAVKQATKFAKAVQELIPCLHLTVPVWDAARCRELGYPLAAAGVVLEETPYSAVDELTVKSRDFETYHTLAGMAQVKGIYAEPYASWLLLFYKD